MTNIAIPEHFGETLESRIYSATAPTIVFVADNHGSMRAQQSIAKTYVHLATTHDLTLVGAEGIPNAVHFTTNKKLPQTSTVQAYRYIDSWQWPFFRSYDPYVRECADNLGLELKIFGYDDEDLTRENEAIGLLYVVLSNPELLEKYSALVPEKFVQHKEIVFDAFRRVSYRRAKSGVEKLLGRIEEHRNLAMMVMGAGKTDDFIRYCNDEIAGQINYYVFKPEGLDDKEQLVSLVPPEEIIQEIIKRGVRIIEQFQSKEFI